LAVCSHLIINAQSTQTGPGVAGHSAGAGGVPIRYCGWDASATSNAIPFSLEHRGTNNINFLTGNVQRMTILGTASGATTGFVGIRTNNPQSQLHIGDNLPPGGGGWRNWMKTGTFICETSDNVYIGLKDEGGFNLKDAVINWGDDPSGSPGPDNFRFIFTASPALGGIAGGTNGLEALRITPFSINQLYMGIGGVPGVNPYSGGSVNPSNVLEINSPALSVLAGTSGLRFTDLKSTSNPGINPGPGVLAVDANGDVIYVTSSGGTAGSANNGLSVDPFNASIIQLGNNIGLTSASLINDREVPMANHNIMFNDNPGSASSIAIGYPLATSSAFIGKFEVNNDSKTTSSLFTTNMSSSTTVQAVTARVTNTGSGNATAISGASLGSAGGLGIGINGSSLVGTSSQNIAINGNARNATSQSFAANLDVLNSTSPQNYGVQVELLSGPNASAVNFGGQFIVGNKGITNYGIYTSVSGATTNWAGYFNGDVFINSPSSGGFIVTPSDQNIKTNIDTIPNALGLINQLEPKTFFYDTLNTHNLKLSSKKQYGVIAQQLESVLPELVGNTTKPADYDSLGNVINPEFTYKAVNYNAFIAILIKGIQEQQSQINTLTAMVNNCCANFNHQMQTIGTSNEIIGLDVNLKDCQSIVLEQNVPNPFAEQTTINYFLPESTGKAQMLFYNAQGKLIQSTELTQKGKGQLNVFASDLTNGIYTYTLVVDGKIVETKKMIKQ
jgi:hypothetical protein